MTDHLNSAILLIHCPDQRGIVRAVTDFIFRHGGNVTALDQYVDPEQGMFFMRVAWSLDQFDLEREDIDAAFADALGREMQMEWSLEFTDHVQRMALFVSQHSHCFYDILARYETGEWRVEIPLVISNHETLRPAVERLGIDFHCLPVNKENKAQQEQKQLELLQHYGVDFVVLARYMQILSEDFVSAWPHKVINIHHSFLPAFAGARPYHAAYERGVKIIGATSHYVTADLDAGPIIEQDVVRVSHEHSIDDLVRKGRDLEKIVLARAIWQHLQHRVLAYRNRTIVF
ncbi:formyltetrahydrofolate deformylase [Solemya velum gill symbiont]|uniref:Formyltetrahydrofolate deformylase n=1 Tax=Solemya velum gill symbiont TaxID=2340 RepID=A0A0B0HF69_SOVGS|nr:formyltetrahydrofolate deformylase [Solemya velum gill symbiont]KHF26574.1 formyltetrahydrofolate deformylase [Solemya velum gill symbiont]OOY36309.1 formyltetrahydrofolate deformylase [Solemya velum gill symbiont]OOY40896.1 formyltetrahydrofolate deformylase [Solemya velum gill symbiont]OOY42399.1 formyltetrahydrofolate deformylase [Solemya velum gill symbiont]OOY45048.1 formyltetrahydrofolate deformylase [Solemya velum gill symbiont]